MDGLGGRAIAERLLKVKEVAERLSISPRSVWRMVAMGELSAPVAVLAGKRWPESEVAAYIERAKARRGL